MPTLLIGYDVEACAIGEGLACLGAHGMGEAIDRTSTARALEILARRTFEPVRRRRRRWPRRNPPAAPTATSSSTTSTNAAG